jgi:hypothetical protein
MLKKGGVRENKLLHASSSLKHFVSIQSTFTKTGGSMNRCNLFIKVIATFLAVSLFVMPISLTAQQSAGTYVEGKVDGEMAAKGNPLWFLAGVGCGCIGVGAAYFIKPSPPAYALVGKSSEYVLGYTEGYGDKSRNKNAGYACAGWLAFVAVYAALGGFSTSSSD